MLQAPLGGDCNEGVKARPGQDVTMRIKVILILPHHLLIVVVGKGMMMIVVALCVG